MGVGNHGEHFHMLRFWLKQLKLNEVVNQAYANPSNIFPKAMVNLPDLAN